MRSCSRSRSRTRSGAGASRRAIPTPSGDGRAAARLKAQGETGARTMLEVAPYLLSPTGLDELIRRDV
ncbi:hypothetical protein HMPREF0569_2050 [Micrococcus luteus SK58]|nr:hypothetical protein HMPREF0569_2050 [Micrococcus luteus SK58]